MSKVFFVFVLLIGVTIGSIINYITSTVGGEFRDYINFIQRLQTKTDAQQPVIKAMRLNKYYEYNDHLYFKIEFIKIRDCRASTGFKLTERQPNGEYTEINPKEIEYIDDNGIPQMSLRAFPADPDKWNVSYWIRIPVTLKPKELFITSQHACTVKFLDPKREIVIESDDGQVSSAIDLVSKTYGPFLFDHVENKNPFLTFSK